MNLSRRLHEPEVEINQAVPLKANQVPVLQNGFADKCSDLAPIERSPSYSLWLSGSLRTTTVLLSPFQPVILLRSFMMRLNSAGRRQVTGRLPSLAMNLTVSHGSTSLARAGFEARMSATGLFPIHLSRSRSVIGWECPDFRRCLQC